MFPNPPLEFLQEILSDSAWPRFALILRWGFLLGLTWTLLRFRVGKPSGVSNKSTRYLSPMWAVWLGLALLLIGLRQGQWQLMGRRNEAFVAFMQRYDRREFNPAHRVRSGKILDRKGRVLAESRVTDQGVRRLYPYGPFSGHVVGYNHPVYGLTGIEGAARRDLLGPGLKSVDDWKELGAELLNREGYAEGPSIYSTLDLGLQRRASELLGEQKGAVVLLDIQTGDVLALVSHPGYDPNRLYEGLFSGKSSGAPLLNRALAGQYPPGSVFKVLIAAAALQKGFGGTFATPPEGFTTSAANPPIRDHEYYSEQRKGKHWRGHGRIDMGTAMSKSSNVFFAQLGVETGAEALLRACQGAGLNRSFNLWTGEEPTLQVKTASIPALSDTQPYQIAQFSIGQGKLLMSPLQVAMIYAGVANNGLVLQPKLDPNAAVTPLGRLCGPEQAQTLKWMLYKVVQEGTGRGMQMPELAVAAKTGTAQTGGDQASHSWFAGFAPVSEPRWAFCVLVEQGGYGSAAALPIARDLLRSGIREGWLKP